MNKLFKRGGSSSIFPSGYKLVTGSKTVAEINAMPNAIPLTIETNNMYGWDGYINYGDTRILTLISTGSPYTGQVNAKVSVYKLSELKNAVKKTLTLHIQYYADRPRVTEWLDK